MENLGLIIGIGCVMLCPMVFGAITAIKSLEHSKMWWEK
jgi:hypothetical protein